MAIPLHRLRTRKGTPMGQYEALAEGVDQLRENTRAMVAGLVADGFSDEQARDIVAGVWRVAGRTNTEDETS